MAPSALAAASPASKPVTPSGPLGDLRSDLLGEVRAARARVMAAEVDHLLLGVEWACAHPDPDAEVLAEPDPLTMLERAPCDDAEVGEWAGLPAVAWDASASFAAANGWTTAAGRAFLRDALTMRHRLPRLWALVLDGAVPVWRARRVAAEVVARPDDIAGLIDVAVADRAGLVGPVVLDRLIDEAMLRLHPEVRELEQAVAGEMREATLHGDPTGRGDETGLRAMSILADEPDLLDFDRALAEVAEALAAQDAAADPDAIRDSLDVRRSRAVGVLADPAAALALLAGDTDWAKSRTGRRVEMIVHVSDLGLLGLDPVAGVGEGHPRPTLDATVRQWCAAPGVRVTVRPVLDLTTTVDNAGYAPTARQRRMIEHRDRTCAFPWCTRVAARCDLDHITPYGQPGGSTSTDNLAALCRHHHRLKTHAGWRYERLGPAGSTTYLWTDPHGQTFLRTRDGTRDLTGPGRPRAAAGGVVR